MIETMVEWIRNILLLVGASFLLLASIGIIRMPDLFQRIQAATKASTLGVGCIILALAVHFNDFGITVRALLVIAFFFLTAPVAAHVIGRAAYFVGVPLWEKTIVDELRGHYHSSTHTLESPPKDEPLPPRLPPPDPPTGSP
jgi:multicomponent Na+:H+ antiporter subunit G